MRPKSPPNPARIAQELYGQIARNAGWDDFIAQVGPLAQYASTPGWEDDAGTKTVPGAKPIGMAQWGAAMTTAGLVTEAVRGSAMPTPGIDPAGFIWLTWRFGEAHLALELRANLLAQTYAWTQVRDGMSRRFEAANVEEVISALRSVMVGAWKACA